jgi:adenylate cyclase
VEEVADVVPIQADAIPFDEPSDESLPAPRESCDVGVLFAGLADVSLAARRSAGEVAATLDALYRTAGEVARAHGGSAERGDLCAVQCVFGAPDSAERAADAVLAAARDLRDRLLEELPGVAFGIGISIGASLAGWIQARRRFEPLVMCAPVSEARRLCEVGARRGPPLLASDRAVGRASPAEACRWSPAARGVSTGR